MLRCMILLVVAAIVPQVSRAEAPPMYPLPPSARDPEHHSLQPGIWEQDSFWMEEAYPATSVVDYYGHLFVGWLPCRRDGNEWQSYEDLRSGDSVLVHEFVTGWISSTNDTAVTLILRYESLEHVGTTPNHEQQVVYLIRFRMLDARSHLSELGVTCAKGT